MITVDAIGEIERASRYLLQQCSAAKNAIMSSEAMERVPEFHAPNVREIARGNVRRTTDFLLTAAEDLNKELSKLPDSATVPIGENVP